MTKDNVYVLKNDRNEYFNFYGFTRPESYTKDIQRAFVYHSYTSASNAVKRLRGIKRVRGGEIFFNNFQIVQATVSEIN